MCNYKSTFHSFCGHTSNAIIYEVCEKALKIKAKCARQSAKQIFTFTSPYTVCSQCEAAWKEKGYASINTKALGRSGSSLLKHIPKRKDTPTETVLARWKAIDDAREEKFRSPKERKKRLDRAFQGRRVFEKGYLEVTDPDLEEAETVVGQESISDLSNLVMETTPGLCQRDIKDLSPELELIGG